MPTLYDIIFDQTSASDYYSKIFGALPAATSTGEILVKCPFHADTTGSMAIKIDSRGGLFYCHGCKRAGNFIQFHQWFNGIGSIEDATHQFISFMGLQAEGMKKQHLDEALPKKYHEALLNHDGFLQYLEKKRGITLKTVRKYMLGIQKLNHRSRQVYRLTIPIKNSEGTLVNIRKWLPEYERKEEADEKIKLIGEAGFNQHRQYPLEALGETRIFICEGELDCLLLRQNGYNAMMSTGGVNGFNPRWHKHYADKEVFIIFDNDERGQKAAVDLTAKLYEYARSVSTISLSTTLDSVDVTDIYIRDPEGFVPYLDSLIENAVPFIRVSEHDIDYIETNLFAAARSDMINKKIKLKAVVIGKEDRPFAIPKRIRLSCMLKKKECPACPGLTDGGIKEKNVSPDSPHILDLLFTNRRNQVTIFREMFNVFCKVRNFDVREEMNVEEIRLAPDIDITAETVSYTVRTAYFIGYGLDYNETYEFSGMTTIDPKNNAVTHVFWKAEKVNSIKESFNITDEIEIDGRISPASEHLKVFQVKEGQTIFAKLHEIYTDLENNVTGIIGRKDIIQAIDLTYHCAIAWNFMGKLVRKGWLDTLVLGDTQCGKTITMKMLQQHYNAGKIYDSTHVSVVGIIGGYITLSGSNRARYVLGIWPLNNGRLVCLDELSGMDKDNLKQLTSVRSEGIAESTKQGQENKFPAKVRFLCLSNPRGEDAMRDYSCGVLAVRKLIGEEADISRFDLVVTAATNEVSSKRINSLDRPVVEHIYTSELCELMVRWAWARKPSDIKITDKAVELILVEAEAQGKIYDSSIPLVLGQSQRYKIARIAIAIAIRTFSTPDGETVIIDETHVDAACKILTESFNKPSMAYDVYSTTRRRENSLPNEEGVMQLLNESKYMIYERLVSNRTGRLTRNDLQEYSGEHQIVIDKVFAELIRYRCIAKKGNFYYATPAFISYLKGYKHPNRDDYFKSPNPMSGDAKEIGGEF